RRRPAPDPSVNDDEPPAFERRRYTHPSLLCRSLPTRRTSSYCLPNLSQTPTPDSTGFRLPVLPAMQSPVVALSVQMYSSYLPVKSLGLLRIDCGVKVDY